MRSKLTAFFVLFAIGVPIIVAVAILVSGEHWFPAGDMAQAELHMRGFFSRPPLVGAAGRIVSDNGFQGSHPGPSPWFAMLPVYLIGARTSAGLIAAAASVHLVSLAGIILLAYRRGGRLLMMLVAITFLAIVRSSGTDFMIEPWNPWLGLLPFAIFVFVVLEILVPIGERKEDCSRHRSDLQIVLAIVVGSHCVQSHAGYALLVVPPLALVLFVSIRRSMKSSEYYGKWPKWTAGTKTVLAALFATVVVWSLPIVDQMRRVPGNLTILIQHFGTPKEPTIGAATSIEIVTTQFNLAGPWLLGPQAGASNVLRVGGFVGFIVLFSVSWYLSRGNRRAVKVYGVLTSFLLLGALSITRIFGPYFEYTIRWSWLLTAICISWSIGVLLSPKSGGARQETKNRFASVAFPAMGICLGVLSVTTIWQVVDRVQLPGRTDSRIIGGLIERVSSELDPSLTYQVRFYDPYTLNATGFGMILELERRGFSVKADPEFAAAALPHRTAPMSQTDEVLWVVVGPAVDAAREDPALEEIAYFNPRSVAQQGRSKILMEAIESGLRSAGRDDLVASLSSPGASILFAVPPLPEETASLVRELIRMGQPTAVFSMQVDAVAVSLQ